MDQRGIDRGAGTNSGPAFGTAACPTYRRSCPDGVKRIAIEAGATALWWKYVGLDGAVIGMDGFGESAPASALFPHFGFTAERIAETARLLVHSAHGLS